VEDPFLQIQSHLVKCKLTDRFHYYNSIHDYSTLTAIDLLVVERLLHCVVAIIVLRCIEAALQQMDLKVVWVHFIKRSHVLVLCVCIPGHS